jgi:hypothetical protein
VTSVTKADNLLRVSLGDSSVQVDCRVPELVEPVTAMLRDTQDHLAGLRTRFVIDRDDERYSVARDDRIVYRGDTAGQICTYLVGEIIHDLIDGNQSELMLHAACVARGGLGVLLPGRSGAGKSTLTGWLLSRGFDYLTDEIVCIHTGSHEVSALTRPLNIKNPGLRAIRAHFGEDFGRDEVLEGSISCLVPYRLFGAAKAPDRVAIHAVVFPEFRNGEPFQLQPLSTARTAMQLMQNFVNARNHEQHGFHDISAFSRSVQGFQLRYSEFDQLTALIEALERIDDGAARALAESG